MGSVSLHCGATKLLETSYRNPGGNPQGALEVSGFRKEIQATGTVIYFTRTRK